MRELMARKLCAIALLVLLLLPQLPGCAQSYGKSTEDLVGVFSIEKTIKLGSGSSCPAAGAEGQDPLDASALQSGLGRNPMGDDQPPSLAGLSIALDLPNSTLILSLHLLDDQSGIQEGWANFSCPAGGSMDNVLILPQDLASGNPRDGLYMVRMRMPAQAGEWVLEDLTLMDSAGNGKALKNADLQSRGMPTGFTVP
jgi:hypothetical protein